uniref:Uncharacterized protein n=1 Tax=Arundo donax TaxID=35708 RepID=A0A0A9B747_ARUDO
MSLSSMFLISSRVSDRVRYWSWACAERGS